MSENEPRERLIEAIRRGDRAAVTDLLTHASELADAVDDNGVSALLLALYHQRPDIAEAIAARRKALTLHESAVLGRVDDVVQGLEREGAMAVENRSPDGFTPLQYAAFFGQEGVVAELLERGAEVGAVSANAMKLQALHSAAANRSIAICRRLLEAGADPNARQHGGYTPLMSAALHGQEELVELLLAQGADPGAAGDDGKTAAALAREGGFAELAERLEAPSG